MPTQPWIRGLLLVAAAFLAACHADPPLPESTAARSTVTNELSWAEITLGPGDLVRVGVYGHPELSTPIVANPSGTRIDADGALSLPLVGPVKVGGLAVAKAREAVVAALAQYVKEPRVDLSVVEYAARRFYLYGEVNKPGAYAIDRPLTLYQALTYGAGYTPRARREQVVLLRGHPNELEVVVFDGESPDVHGMIALRPDDFLFVRRSGPGRFADEVLPILTGLGSALSSIAALILIEDRSTGN